MLCDLRVRINLMSFSVFKRCRIGDVRPNTVTLQLADRSIKHSKGKIEDVLVKADKKNFLVDFIILDYEANTKLSIILGFPFLVTGQTLIDVKKGELTMQVNDEKVTINVFIAMKYPDDNRE